MSCFPCRYVFVTNNDATWMPRCGYFYIVISATSLLYDQVISPVCQSSSVFLIFWQCWQCLFMYLLAIAISIKIEDSSPPPPSLSQHEMLSSAVPERPFAQFETSKSKHAIDDYKPIIPCCDEKHLLDRENESNRHSTGRSKLRHCTPEHHSSTDVRHSSSRSPSRQCCQSHNRSALSSVEIKSERNTPTPKTRTSSDIHRFECLSMFLLKILLWTDHRRILKQNALNVSINICHRHHKMIFFDFLELS